MVAAKNGDALKEANQPVIVEAWAPDLPKALSHWRAVLLMAKRHSATLGFLRDAAFKDRALRKMLLVAHIRGDVVGYCLYDVPRAGHIKLVHVCVEPSARGAGVGKALIDCAIVQHPEAIGVLADCRRDYKGVDRFWTSVGLSPRDERPGRASAGSTLVRWWRPLGPLDLFEEAAFGSGLPLAVLDTNVLRDLHDLPAPLRPDRNASLALEAPWVQSAVTFVVSPQFDVELNRLPSADHRARLRRRTSALTRIRSHLVEDPTLVQALRNAIGAATLIADHSLGDDLKHVADAVNAGAAYFVTNDRSLISATNGVRHLLGSLRVLRPHELVVEVLRAGQRPSYEPRLIESLDFVWRSAVAEDRNELRRLFQDHETGEKAKSFDRALDAAIARIPNAVSVLCDERGIRYALLAQSARGSAVQVEMLRVASGARAQTVALQLARWLRSQAVAAGVEYVQVKDAALGRVASALLIDGFVRSAEGFEARVHDSPASVTDLARHLPDLPLGSNRDVATAERTLWPLIVLDAEVPTYVAPIQPRHADRLFGFSTGTLFAMRKPTLGLSREHVYFSKARTVPEPGARLIWYVTKDDTNVVRMLAAHSRVIEALRMAPEEAHNRFAHIGVLPKRMVMASVAKDGMVAVVRIEDTRLLHAPLSRGEATRLFRRHHVGTPILTFRRVDSKLFDDLIRGGSEVA